MAAALAADDAQTSQPAVERSVSPVVNGKRKREAGIEQESSAEQVAADQDEFYELVDELLFVLKNAHSITSDILSRSITSSVGEESSAKRAKLSPPAADADAALTTTIERQIETRAYTDLEEISTDFDKAIDDYITDSSSTPTPADGAKPSDLPRFSSIQAARSLRADIHDLIAVEQHRNAEDGTAASSTSATSKPKGSQGLRVTNNHAVGQDVLTVFGADYRYKDGGRQWFASRKDPPTDGPDELDPIASVILPSVISVTNIKSMGRPNNRKAKKPSTLGDLVPSPAPSIALKPPQPPTSSVTRSQLVEWHKPSPEPRSSRPVNEDGYASSRLPRGAWLEYSSHADVEESTAEKRLKRDRTLSGGGDGPDAAELEFLQQSSLSRERAKKASLFRSAFSSFAPSHDNTQALVPAEQRSRIWWDKTGADLYQQYLDPFASLSIEEKLRKLEMDSDAEPAVPTEEEVRAMEEAVDEYIAAPEDPIEANKEQMEIDDLLRDISDNIESMIIYQQERLKNVNASSAKANASQVPSAAEEEIYELMRMQLLSIISTLPPSAVSRIDGDKIKKLSVSTVIPLSVPSYSGIIDTSEKAPVPRPTVASAAGVVGRPNFQSPAGTPQAQRTSITQPRSAFVPAASTPVARPAMPSQYSVPGRFSSQYSSQPSQASPMPNGYVSQPNAYRLAAANPGTPTRHPNQYTNRPAQPYQPRPNTYTSLNNSQSSTASPAAGRAGSPPRPPSHPLAQSRGSFSAGTPNSPTTPGKQSMSAGHAASVYRPRSGSSSAPQGVVGTIGALYELSPEEQQAISMKQQQLRQTSSSPQKGQTNPSAQARQPQQPLAQATSKTAVAKPAVNGVAQPVATAPMQGVQTQQQQQTQPAQPALASIAKTNGT